MEVFGWAELPANFETQLDIFSLGLGQEDTLNEVDHRVRAERVHREFEGTFANHAEVEQIVHEGLHEIDLTHDQVEIAINFRVNLDPDQQSHDLVEEKKHRSQRSAHLMAHCRSIALSLLHSLPLFMLSFSLYFSIDTFGLVSQENYNDLFAQVPLLPYLD